MVDRILKVYVASPLGRSEATRSWYRETLLPALAACGVEVLDPWAEGERPEQDISGVPDGASVGEPMVAWRDVNARIGLRNTRLIHQAHGVVAVLDGPDVDSGTAAEIGYATALGRWVLGYRGDARQAGENPGCVVNLQVESFIRLRGEIYPSVDGLIGALKDKVAAFNAGSGPVPAEPTGKVPRAAGGRPARAGGRKRRDPVG